MNMQLFCLTQFLPSIFKHFKHLHQTWGNLVKIFYQLQHFLNLFAAHAKNLSSLCNISNIIFFFQNSTICITCTTFHEQQKMAKETRVRAIILHEHRWFFNLNPSFISKRNWHHFDLVILWFRIDNLNLNWDLNSFSIQIESWTRSEFRLSHELNLNSDWVLSSIWISHSQSEFRLSHELDLNCLSLDLNSDWDPDSISSSSISAQLSSTDNCFRFGCMRLTFILSPIWGARNQTDTSVILHHSAWSGNNAFSHGYSKYKNKQKTEGICWAKFHFQKPSQCWFRSEYADLFLVQVRQPRYIRY